VAAPVVVPYGNRAMQRLGFLKHLVARCSSVPTSTMEAVGRDLLNAASQKVQVPLTDGLAAYISLRLQDRVYREVRDQVAKAGQAEEEAHSTVSVEIQDVHLADRRMPSHTGKLSPKDWKTYHRLPIALGLVRRDSFSLLVRGQAFLTLCDEKELQALRNARLAPNPLLLNPAQQAFLAYTLLEHDHDVLGPLLSQLSGWGKPFRDWEAGDLLPGIFRGVERAFRARANSVAEKSLLQSLITHAASMEKKAGRGYREGKGAREEHITPRLEPLVDCGLLCKPDRYFFQYEFSDAGRRFAQRLAECGDPSHFLEDGFFAAWAEGFSHGSSPETDEDRILQQVMAASDRLKSPLGYAPIVDSVLLGATHHLISGSRYYEVGMAVALLRRIQKQAPKWLQFNIDRQGNMRYLKFAGPRPDGLELGGGEA